MPTNRVKNGDVLLLKDGRILKVIEINLEWGMTTVQFIDQSKHCYLDIKVLEVDRNLRQSPVILMQYHSMNAINVRLNKLANV